MPVSPTPIGVHIGVATCSGSNCHGATQRPRGSAVPGNEYLIWSKRDKHRNAYTVLLGQQAIRMAKALGLPNAASQKLCLDCHADNVAAEMRGRQFQIEDGVGCEGCHGGASGWLGIHISGASHRENIAAGLYPTDQPVKRAELCLNCHFGDDKQFVDHRIYGAGHPRLTFELDTFTAIQPAHFVVDEGYIERKGRITDVQVWATGQVIALIRRMDALVDPRHAPRGMWPEFALFDCQSCHHNYDPARGERPTTTGLGPGTVKLNDANAVMLKVAAARIAPAAAKSLSEHLLALHKATTDDWPGVQREAAVIRATAESLKQAFAHHDFTADDIRALAEALIGLGVANNDAQFSHAEQITMALEALTTGLRSGGDIGPQQGEAVEGAMKAVYAAFPGEGVIHQDVFVKALRDLQRTLRR
ncbi:MAG TPA: multiheme c-type cytochrome [Stellaceae bacterium]|nr:multiheme c-type cytochrome [Stellaceae bacterium]